MEIEISTAESVSPGLHSANILRQTFPSGHGRWTKLLELNLVVTSG